MWYYMTKYSFDPEKQVAGPFNTEEKHGLKWKSALMKSIELTQMKMAGIQKS